MKKNLKSVLCGLAAVSLFSLHAHANDSQNLQIAQQKYGRCIDRLRADLAGQPQNSEAMAHLDRLQQRLQGDQLSGQQRLNFIRLLDRSLVVLQERLKEQKQNLGDPTQSCLNESQSFAKLHVLPQEAAASRSPASSTQSPRK